ncbi:MAG: NAD(P)H-binding protein, partial [Actinobacteria bacterium]|nr:NAD(P)H-binding protein [Actinomycetota bacterium]
MKVLVTGGSGFLGGRTIPLLIDRGHSVTALARTVAAANRVVELGAAPVYGDLDDPGEVDTALTSSGADALVNLASLGFGHASTIVAAAEEANIQRAVFVSTTAIFTSLNAPSKAVRMAAEATIMASSLEWTIVRPTMIYGAPGDRNMERLLYLLRWAPLALLPSGGRHLQQPVHVDDVAAAVVAALEGSRTHGMAYNLAGPEPLSHRQVVLETALTSGRRPFLL